MVTKILNAGARLDDAKAMAALLAPIPDSDQLRSRLKAGEGWRSQRYFDNKGVYIATDGVIVMCFTVTEVTLDQAATIAAECESIKEWSVSAFARAVERVLGKATRVQ